MPGLVASRGARTRAPAGARASGAPGEGSGGRWQGTVVAPQPPGPGDRYWWYSGPWDLNSRPAPSCALPVDLSCAHAPELLCGGEDRLAETLPFAMWAAELVVQVQRDVDKPCGARCWSHAPLGPPTRVPSPRTSAHPGREVPRAGAESRRRCGWRGCACHRSRRPAPWRARRQGGQQGCGRWLARPPCGCCPARSRLATPQPRAARRLQGRGGVVARQKSWPPRAALQGLASHHSLPASRGPAPGGPQ